MLKIYGESVLFSAARVAPNGQPWTVPEKRGGFGIRIPSIEVMETLYTFGQIPLMFIAGFLIVLALAMVWAVMSHQVAPSRQRSLRISRAAFRPDRPDTP
jgi:hypothetical protein